MKKLFNSIFELEFNLIIYLFVLFLLYYTYCSIEGWYVLLRIFFIQAIVIVIAIILLLVLIIILLNKIIKGLTAKSWIQTVAPIAITFFFWNLTQIIPLYPSKVETTYKSNKIEFSNLVQEVLEQRRIDPYYKLSDNDLFDFALIESNHVLIQNKKGSDIQEYLKIEFIIESFYRPLVYVSNDNVNEIYDTCSSGGSVIKKIEPNWYICNRDWN